MLHIAADALAAAVELCPLFFTERKLDHLLDAVCTKDARNAREQPRLARLVVITLMRRSLARARMLGSIFPSRSSPESMAFFT